MSSLQLANVADALGAIDEGTRMVIAGEVAQVLGIAAACDLHRIDESTLVPGTERWVAGGADGTPLIGEFVAGEIGILLQVSPATAMARIATVLNVRHRHPTLWAAVLAGEVRFHEAARVADACVAAGLDQQACLIVDGHCAVALRLQPWSRVRGQVDRWILLADPTAAAERERAAAASRGVEVSAIQDGHCDLWGRLDAGDGIAFDHALSAIAKTLPTEVPFDTRRATAVGILARQTLGQAELPPAAEVVVRIDAPVHEGEPSLAPAAEVAGWGTILTDRLSDLLRGCRVTVRPVLDARALSPSDSYEIPEQMRRVLVERWGADAFPYGSRPAASCQADHTRPFDHHAPPGHGQTHPDLMAPLSAFSHRMKTHGGFGCEQPEPGYQLWTTPHGWTLLTTPTGTIRIGRPPPREHAWWRVEPPDWLDDEAPNDRNITAPGRRGDPPGSAEPPPPAQPPLALAGFLIR